MRYEIIDDFLSKNECIDLIDMAKDRLKSSTTLDPLTGQAKTDDFRKSDQMWFALGENILIQRIERRIADKTSTPIENGEGMQIARYEEGQYFKAHYDSFDTYFEGNQDAVKRGGQRLITVLTYLNDVEGGGETYFHKLDMAVKPRMGRALVWWNLNEDGTIDRDTFHEGRLVPEGQNKWIATKWIRAEKFR